MQLESEPTNANQRMTLLMRAMSNLINFSKMNEIEKIKMRQHLKEAQELWTKLLWQVMEKPRLPTQQEYNMMIDKLIVPLPAVIKKKRGRPGKLKPLCAG